MNIKETTKILTTSLIGTSLLVAIHHKWRKQHDPNAHWQDYLSGLQWQLTKIQNANQAWLKSYQQNPTNIHQTFTNQPSPPEQSTETATVNTNQNSTLIEPQIIKQQPHWISGVANMPYHGNDQFSVVGIDKQLSLVWQTDLPERVHDIIAQPNSDTTYHHDIVVMGRRPSEYFWVLDKQTGQIKQTIKAQINRHFYGHACFSLDGSMLYITENDTETFLGKIGVYDAKNNYQKITEFESYGIGPHQLLMHPNGKSLIIANGGIKTEKASREELNLDSMNPSLVYLNRHNGELEQQVYPQHKQMSIRHLAVHTNGLVLIGIQFQGQKHQNIPLLLTHKQNDPYLRPLHMPEQQWYGFHQYIASVAIDSTHDLLCASSPIGGCAVIMDLNTSELIYQIKLPDCAGVAVANVHDNQQKTGFLISDGQGKLTQISLEIDDNQSDSQHNQHNDKPSKKYKLPPIIQQNSSELSYDNHLLLIV